MNCELDEVAPSIVRTTICLPALSYFPVPSPEEKLKGLKHYQLLLEKAVSWQIQHLHLYLQIRNHCVSVFTMTSLCSFSWPREHLYSPDLPQLSAIISPTAPSSRSQPSIMSSLLTLRPYLQTPSIWLTQQLPIPWADPCFWCQTSLSLYSATFSTDLRILFIYLFWCSHWQKLWLRRHALLN